MNFRFRCHRPAHCHSCSSSIAMANWRRLVPCRRTVVSRICAFFALLSVLFILLKLTLWDAEDRGRSFHFIRVPWGGGQEKKLKRNITPGGPSCANSLLYAETNITSWITYPTFDVEVSSILSSLWMSHNLWLIMHRLPEALHSSSREKYSSNWRGFSFHF